MSTLAGQPIERVELAIPKLGSWRADVVLVGGEAPTGKVQLVVGDLELAGTAFEGGLDSADKPHLVVVSAPGWELPLEEPLSYQGDAGVRLRTVLQDLATRADEQLEQPTDTSVGTHFEALPSRSGDTRLRDVLAALRRVGHVPGWRVDADGVTRFGERSGGDVTDRGRILRRNAALGLRVVGLEATAVSAFLPGAQIEGAPIDRVVVRETSARLEAEVWTS